MKTTLITGLGISLFPLIAACAAAGTQPHAMGATEHAAAANQEQQSADAHGAKYNPAASASQKRCGPAKSGAICWTSTMNPTAEHDQDAEHHRELAAEHRAASEALRGAEASACSGIPEQDRDMSPFAHREDIRSVSPVTQEVRNGKTLSNRTAGTEIVFRAVPGMTAEWLQRLVDCHLARNSAIGHQAASADMPYCPLTVRGAQASVRSVGDGFAVTIRSEDYATSAEISRRSESLKPQPLAGK
ncbi:MAG: hypothetical protein ABI895_21880 [Deltaproteobacteria bacterium]